MRSSPKLCATWENSALSCSSNSRHKSAQSIAICSRSSWSIQKGPGRASSQSIIGQICPEPGHHEAPAEGISIPWPRHQRYEQALPEGSLAVAAHHVWAASGIGISLNSKSALGLMQAPVLMPPIHYRPGTAWARLRELQQVED